MAPVVSDSEDDHIWFGAEKLVLAFDVGATCSAVSYSYLYTGGKQSIKRVTQWEGEARSSKVPSRMYYSSDGEAVLKGARAATDDAELDAMENKWELVELFKLLLHPRDLSMQHNLTMPPDLPFKLSILIVYADFLGYLLEEVRKFFISHTPDGDSLWTRLFPSSDIVLAHPNGWRFNEQRVLRDAAIQAGLVSGETHQERLHFVTEAEASVHFCLRHANIQKYFKPGLVFVVCDAGGSTVDTTSYTVKETAPLKLVESKVSGCVQAGGLFVNEEAGRYLEKTFRDAGFKPKIIKEYVSTGLQHFEKLKKDFTGDKQRYRLEVAPKSVKYQGNKFEITSGRMTLDREVVASFFEPSIQLVTADVESQSNDCSPQYLFLVGGYGECVHLRARLEEVIEPNITVLNDESSKAVADGGVIWRLSQKVIGRRTRYTYGVQVKVPANSVAHGDRPEFLDVDGGLYVRGVWSCISIKNSLVNEDDGASIMPYSLSFKTLDGMRRQLRGFRAIVVSYDGILAGNPFCLDVNDSWFPDFSPVCTITGDLSGLADYAKPKIGPLGNYFVAGFKVGILFGGTQLQAFVQWTEKGDVKRGPLSLIPGSLAPSFG